MKFILNYIRKEEWSPYVAGILLGVVGVLAVLLSNSLLFSFPAPSFFLCPA